MKTIAALVLALAIVAAIGCTPMNVVMTNPVTGRSVYISHYSYGLGMGGIMAALAAEQQQKKAIEAAKMMGYTEMREVK